MKNKRLYLLSALTGLGSALILRRLTTHRSGAAFVLWPSAGEAAPHLVRAHRILDRLDHELGRPAERPRTGHVPVETALDALLAQPRGTATTGCSGADADGHDRPRTVRSRTRGPRLEPRPGDRAGLCRGRVFGAHCLAVIGTAWNTFGTSLVLYFPGWAFGPTPPK